MKGLVCGLIVAFSMYSAIPMPQVKWERATMRWALCFLPLVGAVIGAAEYGWFRLCTAFGVSGTLYAVIAAALPAAISGGIHLDGLTDVCDALGSHGTPEKRLEIMHDPRTGAFGVLGLLFFVLLEIGLFYQVYETPAGLPSALVGFFFARCVGGRAIVALPCAKNTGLAYLFAENTEKQCAKWILTAEFFICAALFCGYNVKLGVALAVLALLWTAAHRRLCVRSFGGITGDLAGFLISTTELLGLVIGAIGGVIK